MSRQVLIDVFHKRNGKYMDYTDVFNTLKVDKEKDTFYPVCDNGETRSQILHLVLNKQDYKTALPHGTGVGNDIRYNKDDYMYFSHLLPKRNLPSNPRNREFKAAFGEYFVARAGEKHVLEEELELFHSDYDIMAGSGVYWHSAAEHMKQWFTDFYFSHPKKEERKIYLCFQDSAVHIIERLLDTHENLNGFVVVRLPQECPSSSQLQEFYTYCERSLVSLFN